MTVLLRSVLTVSCYNQQCLISSLLPVTPKAARPTNIFQSAFYPPQSFTSVNKRFTSSLRLSANLKYYQADV